MARTLQVEELARTCPLQVEELATTHALQAPQLVQPSFLACTIGAPPPPSFPHTMLSVERVKDNM